MDTFYRPDKGDIVMEAALVEPLVEEDIRHGVGHMFVQLQFLFNSKTF